MDGGAPAGGVRIAMRFDWEQPGMSPLFRRTPVELHDSTTPWSATCAVERKGCRANVIVTLHDAGPVARVHIELAGRQEITPEEHDQFNIELFSGQLIAEAVLLKAAGKSEAEVDAHVSLSAVADRFAAMIQRRDEVTRANRYN